MSVKTRKLFEPVKYCFKCNCLLLEAVDSNEVKKLEDLSRSGKRHYSWSEVTLEGGETIFIAVSRIRNLGQVWDTRFVVTPEMIKNKKLIGALCPPCNGGLK